MNTDFLIIGAGFSGLVAAHQLSQAGWKCVVVDRRNHLGGNAYDGYDAAGVLLHHYGPHYFRTNSPRIVEYLSAFTEWREVAYTIKSHVQGRLWSFPINLNTYEELIGRAAESEEFQEWLERNRLPIESPQNSEEVILSQVGHQLYEMFFEGYTMKQWQRHPRELDRSVCGRIPIRTNRDDRYLTENFQALPKAGYTKMLEKMLDASPSVQLFLNMDAAEARAKWNYKYLIFSGAIDDFYQKKFGPLPYRSLRFEPESFTAGQLAERQKLLGENAAPDGFWQTAMQINYPEQNVPWTRIVEIKHATGQQIDATTIVREYPKDWTPDDEPFYPVPTLESQAIYRRYQELATAEQNVTFIGRLATYRYYNMDQVTGMALTASQNLIQRFGTQL
ncbi:MAG: UDP-galactopyranose mutase [Verrucomicrobia bacterium]|nr:MAG: UDP-galactopyranose mutase [Verrucomicrobiota bacterium]